MSVAFLFPGQGAQSPGFLSRLPDHSRVHETLEEAAHILGSSVWSLDTEEALASTVAVQLSTFIAGVAVSRALASRGLQPDAVAGQSVGAFAAAVACHALAFADALRLVKLRGECMQRIHPYGYGMAAILGLDERTIAALLQSLGASDAQLYVANVNAPTQIVVAGADAPLTALLAAARESGARETRRLAVTVPSHSPLMHDVSRRLAAAMRDLRLQSPRMPYISNCRARAVHNAAGIQEDLIGNVAQTVRWHDSVVLLYELGTRLFIEMPPGWVLCRLAQAAFADARSIAVQECGLESALQLAQRDHSPP